MVASLGIRGDDNLRALSAGVLDIGSNMMDVTFQPLSDLEALAAKWRDLEQRADASFFQSWSWIGAWLRALPSRAAMYVLSIEQAGTTVGIGMFAKRSTLRRRVLPVRGLFLSETGDPGFDVIAVEHNGILLERGLEAQALEAAARALCSVGVPWDELQISGVESRRAPLYQAAWSAAGTNVLKAAEKPYFTVALDRVREQGGDYLASLSGSTRSQLRRSKRDYEGQGPVRIDFAADEAQAHHYLARLRVLHQAHWVARGLPGAFATDFANEFHRHLIAEAMPRGEIQLAEISCGERPIAYLYNFRHRGIVSNYQSGIQYSDNSKLKPGMTAHQLAIEHNLRSGERVYDLLMGDQRYKKSLATDEGTMSYLVVQRRRLRFRLENAARALALAWGGGKNAA
jgi:CelD/BcsL family acetyltransferase involved in cellulose biosynthesis